MCCTVSSPIAKVACQVSAHTWLLGEPASREIRDYISSTGPESVLNTSNNVVLCLWVGTRFEVPPTPPTAHGPSCCYCSCISFVALRHFPYQQPRRKINRFSRKPRYCTHAPIGPSQVAVPAIGPRLPGLAFISAIKALLKYDVMIEEGHRKVRRHRLSQLIVLSESGLVPSFQTASSSYRC